VETAEVRALIREDRGAENAGGSGAAALSMEERHRSDVLAFMMPRIYREDPRLCAIREGHSTTLLGKREFTLEEKCFFSNIRFSVTDELPKCDFAEIDYSFVYGSIVEEYVDKLMKKAFGRIRRANDAASFKNNHELDDKAYSEVVNLLRDRKEKITELD
jgi:hypothetical protein